MVRIVTSQSPDDVRSYSMIVGHRHMAPVDRLPACPPGGHPRHEVSSRRSADTGPFGPAGLSARIGNRRRTGSGHRDRDALHGRHRARPASARPSGRARPILRERRSPRRPAPRRPAPSGRRMRRRATRAQARALPPRWRPAMDAWARERMDASIAKAGAAFHAVTTGPACVTCLCGLRPIASSPIGRDRLAAGRPSGAVSRPGVSRCRKRLTPRRAGSRLPLPVTPARRRRWSG